ncbi:MAG TPA: NAD-dependent epimerase/dehydratase family protein [Candidatus Bilamarchaeum sp.]|nr:NAD-dependent epimerase/dehydratase family protein [Candidatus Bilamarchaeum sp.]
MEILIIGGSRFVGPLLVSRLKEHDVTVFNRGTAGMEYPEGVEFIRGDRNEPMKLGREFDAVIDMCAYEGRQTAKALEELEFKFFIHMGTAAAYRKSSVFPLTEESPLGAWPLWGDYNRGKVACETVLSESGIQYASVRPVYILGPNNYVPRESFIYSRLQRGQEIALPGNGQAIAQFVFADEVAESIALIAKKKAKGAFNCCGDDLVTLQGLVEMMAGICRKSAKLSFNVNRDGSRFTESEFPFANENFICSSAKIKSLGAKFRTLREGLESDYLSCYRATSGGK